MVGILPLQKQIKLICSDRSKLLMSTAWLLHWWLCLLMLLSKDVYLHNFVIPRLRWAEMRARACEMIIPPLHLNGNNNFAASRIYSESWFISSVVMGEQSTTESCYLLLLGFKGAESLCNCVRQYAFIIASPNVGVAVASPLQLSLVQS